MESGTELAGRLRHPGIAAVLDWSTWARLPLPPGRVTAIAACQFDQRASQCSTM